MSQYTLTIAGKAPLVGYQVLVAASVINRDVPTSPIELKVVDDVLVDKADSDSLVVLTKGDQKVTGVANILNTFSTDFEKVLYSTGNKEECDKWVKFALEQLTVKDFKAVTPALESLETFLNFRSYIVGYSATIADIAIWGSLRSNGVVGAAVKNGTFVNIGRWYNMFNSCKYYGGAVDQMTKDLNEVRKQGNQGKKKESKASYDIDLVDAVDGKVVTRFPPEPSGYLHIGHAKAAILNQYFAKMYHGKLIIRFDDTNPSKENVEFEDSIVADLELLGIKGDQVTHSSDYFDKMYELAIQMIKEGKAYCDDTPTEQMREERGEGIASKRRERTVEENLKVFTEEMTNATEEGSKNCLRAKVSVDNPNKAMRDPVIYRVNATPHHRTGSTWKLYPTYDFCCPIVDAIEGVTHALRTTEYRDRNAQYQWMLDAMNLRKVHVWDFSRINFTRTLLSKRKLQWFVDQGHVSGWDDPRFPTVRGVRRRGMTVEGLQAFIISQGPSKNILNLDWSSIWAQNKKVIDPIVPRFTAITKEGAVKVNITDGPQKPYTEEKPKHKKNAELGKKPVIYANSVLIDQDDARLLKDNEEVTLMDWGNAIIQKIVKDGDNVTQVDMKLHLEGDFKKTEKKLTWVSDTEDVANVDLVDFDHLITKEKIEEGEKFEDFLTPQTEFHKSAIADLNVKGLKEGDIIQFERKGYYRLDKAATGSSPAVFFTIPDGKTVMKYGAKST